MGPARRSTITPPDSSRPRPERRGAPGHRRAKRLWRGAAVCAGVPALSVLLIGSVFTATAVAAQPAVGLGTATPFAVLGGSTVTNTGASVISGDVGVYPGTAVVGFPPGLVNNGTIHAADAVALQAQSDVTTAYNDAAGRTPAVTESSDLGGQTLAPGVYQAASALSLTGTVTLDAAGDQSAVFIFQAGSTLITASSSSVSLIGGAQACNVFWQVGSSATLGTATSFVGTILALTSASLDTGATLQGRVFARNGAVTLDDNVITQPGCATTTPTTTTTSTTAGSTSTTSPTSGSAGGTTSSGATGSVSTTGSVVSGEGSSGAGSAAGTTTSAVIPLGAPHTGLGGASRSRDDALIGLGAVAVLAAGGTAAVAGWRRRRASQTTASATFR